MRQTRILVFAGSTQGGSISARLAALLSKELAQADADITRISLADYPLPLYDGDLEKQQGVPEPAKKLARMFCAHHGVMIVTPEYNASIPPLVKNTIDWVSRRSALAEPYENPYKNRVFAVAAASNGQYGGVRALLALRPILELGVGATLIPEQLALAHADSAYAADGSIADERIAAVMRVMVKRLIDEASRYAV